MTKIESKTKCPKCENSENSINSENSKNLLNFQINVEDYLNDFGNLIELLEIKNLKIPQKALKFPVWSERRKNERNILLKRFRILKKKSKNPEKVRKRAFYVQRLMEKDNSVTEVEDRETNKLELGARETNKLETSEIQILDLNEHSEVLKRKFQKTEISKIEIFEIFKNDAEKAAPKEKQLIQIPSQIRSETEKSEKCKKTVSFDENLFSNLKKSVKKPKKAQKLKKSESSQNSNISQKCQNSNISQNSSNFVQIYGTMINIVDISNKHFQNKLKNSENSENSENSKNAKNAEDSAKILENSKNTITLIKKLNYLKYKNKKLREKINSVEHRAINLEGLIYLINKQRTEYLKIIMTGEKQKSEIPGKNNQNGQRNRNYGSKSFCGLDMEGSGNSKKVKKSSTLSNSSENLLTKEYWKSTIGKNKNLKDLTFKNEFDEEFV